MGRERNPRFSHGAHALCRRARTCSTSVRRCRRREGGTVPGLARVVDRGDVVIRIDPRSAGVASRRPSPRRRSMGGVEEGAGGWTGPRAHERFAPHQSLAPTLQSRTCSGLLEPRPPDAMPYTDGPGRVAGQSLVAPPGARTGQR